MTSSPTWNRASQQYGNPPHKPDACRKDKNSETVVSEFFLIYAFQSFTMSFFIACSSPATLSRYMGNSS